MTWRTKQMNTLSNQSFRDVFVKAVWPKKLKVSNENVSGRALF